MKTNQFLDSMRKALACLLCAAMVFTVPLSAMAADQEDAEIEDVEIAEAPVEETEPADETEETIDEEAKDALKHDGIIIDADQFPQYQHLPLNGNLQFYFKLYSFGDYANERFVIRIYQRGGSLGDTLVFQRTENFPGTSGIRPFTLTWNGVSSVTGNLVSGGEYYLTFCNPAGPAETDSVKYTFYIDPPAPEQPEFRGIVVGNNMFVNAYFKNSSVVSFAKDCYSIYNEANEKVAISEVTYNYVDDYATIRFGDPLNVGYYWLTYNDGSKQTTTVFYVSMASGIHSLPNNRNIIVQFNAHMDGCTNRNHYSLRCVTPGHEKEIGILNADSAYYQLGCSAENVFRLALAEAMEDDMMYELVSHGMTRGGEGAQDTVTYFKTDSTWREATTPISSITLTNNQSIIIDLPHFVNYATDASNYVITNLTGDTFPVNNVRALNGQRTRLELNFPEPLKADLYFIRSKNMGEALEGQFAITLDLSIVKVDNNSFIIQLNSPIYGCTDAPNYFLHKLGSNEEITAVSAVSAFDELKRAVPNVFRITLPTNLEAGQTYIVETRNMALDSAWAQPCQGTIAYFTK